MGAFANGFPFGGTGHGSETLAVLPLALAVIFWLDGFSGSFVIAPTGGQAIWLILAGLVTLLPLVWYNAAAAR